MTNCICHGTVRHRRLTPKVHAFSYRDTMFYLSLADLENPQDEVMRACAKRIRRSDHFGDPSEPLSASVVRLLDAQLGIRQRGPIDMLTHIRQLGYVMNPVSFYYCWNNDRSQLTAIIAEINNTPWGERYCYAFPASGTESHTYRFGKEFHVSPFISMDQQYVWEFRKPGSDIHVSMQNYRNDQLIFEADLQLHSKPLSDQQLSRFLRLRPFTSTAVISRIYVQALYLWLKGTPYHRHPRRHPNIDTCP